MGRARLPRQDCARCGRIALCSRLILDQPVCRPCELRFARDPQPCPGCGQLKVLAYYDQQRRPACATCTGNPPRYACRQCGREDSPWGHLCGPCAIRERLTELMSAPGGGIHPQLQPVFETLLAGPRPQTTLYWMTRSAGPDILRRMATGDLPISHQAFEQLLVNRVTCYVRDLLAATGVLPPFHAELERVQPWLKDYLTTLASPVADVLRRYATWQVLRRLRRSDQGETLTHGAISAARADIITAARFLTWLHEHQVELGELTQPVLEQYADVQLARAKALRGFLRWTHQSRLTARLEAPRAAQSLPQVSVGHDERWAHVQTLLHDDSIRLYVRVAGLFILLYAQPLSRVCRMRREQISVHPDHIVTVTFDTVPIELPTPLNRLVIAHLGRRGQASYVSQPDHWLFPGGLPGKHLVTENIRGQLLGRGIPPGSHRNAALYQLAAEMPVPVLADLLGLSTTAATRWATLAGPDWATYMALRYQSTRP